MKNLLKYIPLLFVAIALLLASADYRLSTASNSCEPLTESSMTCDDIQFECSEDDNVFSSSNVIAHISSDTVALLFALEVNFQDSYSPFVWQPPKFS